MMTSDDIRKAISDLFPRPKLVIPSVLQPDPPSATSNRPANATTRPVPKDWGTLKFFPITIALQRLVDLDALARHQTAKYLPELDRVSATAAKQLYEDAFRAALADLISSSRSSALVKARAIVNFVVDRQSLDGLESLFLSGMSILQLNGNPTLARGFELLSQMQNGIGQISGDMPLALFFDSQSRSIVGLTLDQINQLVTPGGRETVLRQGSDISSSVSETETLSPAAKRTVQAVCVAEAAAIGTIVGIGVGTLGGPPGEVVGGILGGVVGTGLGAYFCGGGTPPSDNNDNGDGDDSGNSTNSPGTPQNGNDPGTPSATNDPGGDSGDDDSGDDNSGDDGGPQVGGGDERPVFGYDGGEGDPSDTPSNGVHHVPITSIPDQNEVKRLVNRGDPVRGDFSEMPHFVDSDDGQIAVMGKLRRNSVINPVRSGDGFPPVGDIDNDLVPHRPLNPGDPRGPDGGNDIARASNGRRSLLNLQIGSNTSATKEAWTLLGEGIARALLRMK